MAGKSQHRGNHACPPLFFIGRWLSISPVSSAIQVAAVAHPRFDLRVGDQRASRDPEALSRLRDEQLLIQRENASRHKGNRERNQKSRRDPVKRSERTNELIGHAHLQQNVALAQLEKREYITLLVISVFIWLDKMR